MRPDVVLFGELLDPENVLRSRKAAERCDVCLVVGTSGLVYPANELPQIAKAVGAFVVEVNPERTILTPICDVSIRAPSSEVLPEIFTE
jgi:NAD-dependent deacetylase